MDRDAITSPGEPAVGDAEPCDWCGRPGTVEQLEMWAGNDTLECRNPALCTVCSYWLGMPGGAVDAIYDAGLDEYDSVMQPFEDELRRKWREKVAHGQRRPQGPDDRSLFQSRGSFSPEQRAP